MKDELCLFLHCSSVISRNLKSGGGGIDKCFRCRGGANIPKEQIDVKKHWKRKQITLSSGGVVSQLGGSFPSLGGA